MFHKSTLPQTTPSPNVVRDDEAQPVTPVSPPAAIKDEDARALAKIGRLLDAERYEEAFALARSRSNASMRNASGVCLMRMGKPDEAVRIYRGLVLDRTGLFLRDQVPMTFKINYALALMLSGHPVGGINILEELASDNHPSLQLVREAVQDWKSQLSFLQKLGLKLGVDPNRPVVLRLPPGVLE